NELLYSFIALFSGILIFTLALLWPKFNYREVVRLRKQSNTTSNNRLDGWDFLLPKDGHFVTSIIIHLNILVFLIMVFSGVSFIAPSMMDMLVWGGNNKYQLLQG